MGRVFYEMKGSSTPFAALVCYSSSWDFILYAISFYEFFALWS